MIFSAVAWLAAGIAITIARRRFRKERNERLGIAPEYLAEPLIGFLLKRHCAPHGFLSSKSPAYCARANLDCKLCQNEMRS